MSIIQYLISGGMASIGSDLEEDDQTKINEVAKLFSTEMRKYAVGMQVPAAILGFWFLKRGF